MMDALRCLISSILFQVAIELKSKLAINSIQTQPLLSSKPLDIGHLPPLSALELGALAMSLFVKTF